MKIISKVEKERLSKQATDIQLPKINKTDPHEGTSYQARYQWANLSSEYSQLNNKEIVQQRNYLLQELKKLTNYFSQTKTEESRVSTKPLSKLQYSSIKKSCLRQLQVNNLVISSLQRELDGLAKQVRSNTQQNIEDALIQAKEKMAKLKEKIKKIQQKSRQMENSFQSGYEIYQEMEKLQQEKNLSEARKLKMQEKLVISNNNIKTLDERIAELSEKYALAQQFHSQNYFKQKIQIVEKQLEGIYYQKTYEMQVTRKTLQSQSSVKQNRYYQLLKTLQTQVLKLQLLQKQQKALQIRDSGQKEQLHQLEDQLKLQKGKEKEKEKENQNEREKEREKHTISCSLEPRFHKIDLNIRNHDIRKEKTKIELQRKRNQQVRPSHESTNGKKIRYNRNKTSFNDKTDQNNSQTSKNEKPKNLRFSSQLLAANHAYYSPSNTKKLHYSKSQKSNLTTAVTVAVTPNNERNIDTKIHQEILEQSPRKQTAVRYQLYKKSRKEFEKNAQNQNKPQNTEVTKVESKNN